MTDVLLTFIIACLIDKKLKKELSLLDLMWNDLHPDPFVTDRYTSASLLRQEINKYPLD